MNADINALAQEIQTLVRATSLETIENLANILLQSDGLSRELVRTKLISSATNFSIRAQIENLFQVWQRDGGQWSSSAIALALVSAARIQETHRRAPTLDLVWTGPDSQILPLRRTDQALLQLIDEAQTKLLIVSFAVYKIPAISSAIVAAAQRGVAIRICIESPQASEGRIAYDTLRALGAEVAAHSQIYIWPNSKRQQTADGKRGALHAKVAVADGRTMLLSSANLTDYAMNLNMELGVLIDGGELPGQVEEHFQQLIAKGILELLKPI